MNHKVKRAISIGLCFLLMLSCVTPLATVSHAEATSQDISYESTDSGDENDTKTLIGEKREDNELPLSEGELQTIQSADASFTIHLNDDGTITTDGTDIYEDLPTVESEQTEEESLGSKILSSIADIIFPSMVAEAASDSLKVSYSGYVGYCGHRMGYKYISSSGDYENHLVYCMNISKLTTNGTVKSGGNVPAKITFCLVNGARKKNGKCYTDKYSLDDAKKDYFITGAAIHVLNGEVKLSYYNDGSSVYKKIKAMVEDAKSLNKSEYNTKTGTTKKVSYTVAPKKSNWKQISDGLYRSENKFVRTKTGTITRVKYKITGAPSGLTTGEIAMDASDISDEEDLKKYDICVAQTNTDAASSNFYVYANQDAYDAIMAEGSTVKVSATAYGDEQGGRKWTPTVVSQQKITFLETIPSVPYDAAYVKILVNEPQKGMLTVKKTDSFDPGMNVSGATYGLYEDEDCEELLCELHPLDDTNASAGLYASDIEELTQKKYYLKELENPDGYLLDEKVYEIDESYFTILDANKKVIRQGKEFTHEEERAPVSVMVIKKDAESGETIMNAKFAVFNDYECTKRTIINPKDPDSPVVPEFGYDEDLDAYVSESFVRGQEEYYVKEISVPFGYFDGSSVHTIKPDDGEMVTIDVDNEPIKCSVSAVKEDKETRYAQGDAKLSGATYGLYAKTDINHPDGIGLMRGTEIKCDKGTEFTAYDLTAVAGTLLATVKTDEKGEFGFSNLYLGDYYIKEIAPSEGYLIDETEYPLNFSTMGNTKKTLSIDITSKEQVMKQPFEIIKVSTDGATGPVDKVQGAEFTVKLNSEIAKVGWDKAKVYDKLTSDKKGYALSIELPYGTYTVRETKTPADLDTVPDFTVVVDHDDRTPQEWRILNDAPFEAYIRIIKQDAETGKTVLLSDTTFKLRRVGESDYITQKLGDKYITEFKTDETGTVTTPLKLKYGDYEVVEVKAPTGYLIHDGAIQFKVTTTGAVKVDRDKDGDAVIDVVIANNPVKGKVIIKKTGEKLVGARYDTIIDRIFTFFTGDNRSVTFEYEERPLAKATFNLIADEDIYTPDYQVDESGNRTIAVYNGRTLKKGEIAAAVTTDDKGEATVDNLPLGKYHLEETDSPIGYTPPDELPAIDLVYADDHTVVIESKSDITNIRQQVEVSLKKTEAAVKDTGSSSSDDASQSESTGVEAGNNATDSQTTPQATTGSAVIVNESTAGIGVEGATYGIFATQDIKDIEGNLLVEAQTLISTEKTDAEGVLTFTSDLPLGKYYVKEVETTPGYLIDEAEYEVDFTNPEKGVKLTLKSLSVEDIPIITGISKQDIVTSAELPDATLQIFDEYDELFAEWQTDGKPYYISAIPAGNYTLIETAAPYGYMITNAVDFTVEETGEIQKVVMVDDRVRGIIEIHKTDRETGDTLSGVEFEVLSKDGKRIETITTDSKGIARSSELDIGTYKENGEFDKAYTYRVREVKAADGYKLSAATYDVKFEYDDSAIEPVVKILNITNEPVAKKLPQTGGQSHMWMYLVAVLIGAGIGVMLHIKHKKNGGK